MGNAPTIALACLALAAACGKGKTGGGERCPPGEVTVGDQTLSHSYGRALRANGALVVQLYDHDEVTCDELMATELTDLVRFAHERGKTNDEFSVRVSHGGLGNAIGLGGNTFMNNDLVKAQLVASPGKVGDTAAICLTAPAEYELQVGPHRGKKLVMKGLFEGKYCGER